MFLGSMATHQAVCLIQLALEVYTKILGKGKERYMFLIYTVWINENPYRKRTD